MARGKTLDALLTDLRAEVRVSLNAAHNTQVRETQIKMLQHTQDWLWSEYDWPHMMVDRHYALQAGQRYYDFSADFELERINSIHAKNNGAWAPLHPGIGDAELTAFDSDLDQRSTPVLRWKLAENDEIEIWPIPDVNGDLATFENCLRVTGIKRLAPLVAESDRADLDDRLIVLYAAAEMLAAAGSKDASLKLQKANARMASLRGGQTKTRSFQMFGVNREEPSRRMAIRQYRPAGT